MTPARSLLPVLLLSGLLGLAPASAPIAAPDPVTGAAPRTVTLNLNNADLLAFISTVADVTGRNFIIDPRVRGQVTVLSSSPVAPDQLYDIFLAVLNVHGFTAVEGEGVVKIVPQAEAKQDTVREGQTPLSEQLVTQVVEIRKADAAQLVPIIRPLMPQYAYLAAHPNTNTLIITDIAQNVKRVLGIIAELDRPADDDIKVVTLKNSQAAELLKTLDTLNKSVLTRGEPQALAPQIQADERTNSLILSGNADWRKRVMTLIQQLDQATPNDDHTEVLFLQHAVAKDLVEILRGVGSYQAEAGPAGGEGGAAAASGGGKKFDIQADEATNSLIVTGQPMLLKSIKDVIARLDVRRAQVHIEAVIAELSDKNAVELGVQWRTSPTSDGLRASSTFGSGNATENLGDVLSGVIGNGLMLGYYSGGSLRALLRTLATDGTTNILSAPSLITLDNAEATIHVGKNVPMPTGRYTDSVMETGGGTNTSTNTSNYVSPFTTIEREDVGIKLKVKPRITEGKALRLEIEQEVSDVAETDPINGPTTNKRVINTTVLVDDNQVVVLGGLIEDSLSEGESKIPLLGDIPLAGNLFKTRNTETNKRNLMVFLRPHIVRDQEGNAEIVVTKYDQIRAMQEGRREQGVSLMPAAQPPMLSDDLRPADAPPRVLPAPEAPAPQQHNSHMPTFY